MELEECEHLPLESEASSKHCLTLGVGDLTLNRGKSDSFIGNYTYLLLSTRKYKKMH